jgi:hypothetical protein
MALPALERGLVPAVGTRLESQMPLHPLLMTMMLSPHWGLLLSNKAKSTTGSVAAMATGTRRI